MAGRYARASAHRTQGLRRRRRPKQNTISRMLGAVRPRWAAKRAAPTSRKGTAGGLAMVAAAAGMAFKNRGKLKRSGGANEAAPPSPPPV
jgi:hypothetical protein